MQTKLSGAQLGPGHGSMLPETPQPSHHAKEAEGETWLRFIGWVMEGWANYNKGRVKGGSHLSKSPGLPSPEEGDEPFPSGF